jgi:hypothetical protein
MCHRDLFRLGTTKESGVYRKSTIMPGGSRHGKRENTNPKRQRGSEHPIIGSWAGLIQTLRLELRRGG